MTYEQRLFNLKIVRNEVNRVIAPTEGLAIQARLRCMRDEFHDGIVDLFSGTSSCQAALLLRSASVGGLWHIMLGCSDDLAGFVVGLTWLTEEVEGYFNGCG